MGVKYKNGNYFVTLDDQGTKKRWVMPGETDLKPLFPESIDMKITNYCDLNCPYCHEESTTEGKHAKFSNPKVKRFLENLKPGMEVAIGGGNPLDHPQLEKLLRTLKKQGVIANMTVNQRHLLKYREKINDLAEKKLVNAFGISVSPKGLSESERYALNYIEKHSQVVLHLIAGINDLKQEDLKEFKALMLGYKLKGRGREHYNQNSDIFKNISKQEETFEEAIMEAKLISMDNLAIKQLNPYRFLGEEYRDKHFMGEDGTFSMYVDLVNETFAVSSTKKTAFHLYSDHTLEEIFGIVRKETVW